MQTNLQWAKRLQSYEGAGGDFRGDEYVHYFNCIDGFMSI